jgi:Integrase core domain
VRRFEWPCPGDLLQMDTKRLGRFDRPGHKVTGDRYRTAKEKRNGPGWEFCHSIIDDHSRLAYTEIDRDEKAPTVTAFVERALAFFAAHSITAKAPADRQRVRLHPQPLAARAAGRPPHRASPHSTAHPQAQRQGRALPTDPRPRMGRRPALPQLGLPSGSAVPSRVPGER